MAEKARFRDALAGRDARLLTWAYVVDLAGTWAYGMVLLVTVYHRTGSTLMVSLASLCAWVPRLFLGPYGGLLADRFERTAVMRVSATVAGLLMSLLTVVVAVDGPVALMLVLAMLTSVSTSPYSPAAGALRTAVVGEKDLVALNALFTAFESTAIVVGPLVGALVLWLGAPAIAFGINAASFFVAVLLVARIQVRSTGAPAEESFGKELSAGLVAVWNEPVARALVLLIALDSAVYGAASVAYIPLGRHLGAGANGLTLLIAAFALGGVAITAAVNRLAAGTRLTPAVVGGMLLLAVPFAAAVLTRQLWLGLLLQALAGAGMIVVDVLGLTVLQRDVPRGVLGRVMGVVESIALVGILAGSLLTVPLLRIGGIDLAFGTLLAAVLIGTAIGVRPLARADHANAEKVALLRPRIELLEALDLFVAAPYPVLERLASAIEVVVAEAGTTLMRQGERADALWIVVNGAVRVTSQAGVDVTLGAHSYVGEIGLLHGVPRTATVRAIAPTLLWRIPAEEFRAALAETSSSTSLRSISASRMRQLSVAPVPEPAKPVDEDALYTL